VTVREAISIAENHPTGHRMHHNLNHHEGPLIKQDRALAA
jgi:hypothetical protein